MRIHWPWKNKRQTEVPLESTSVSEFRREIDRLFERFVRGFWGDEGDWSAPPSFASSFTPRVDISEKGDEITLRAEVPGVDPKNLDVSLSGDVLTIVGEKEEEEEIRGGEDRPYHVERRFGSFRRSMRLPAEVDPERIRADYANGVLTIRLQRAEGAERKKIDIKVK